MLAVGDALRRTFQFEIIQQEEETTLRCYVIIIQQHAITNPSCPFIPLHLIASDQLGSDIVGGGARGGAVGGGCHCAAKQSSEPKALR